MNGCVCSTARARVFSRAEHITQFGRTCPNPVVLLLSVSHQLRHVTLKTISTALEIPYSEGGIGRCVAWPAPWQL